MRPTYPCSRAQAKTPRSSAATFAPRVPDALPRAPLAGPLKSLGVTLAITLPRHRSEGLPLYPQRRAAATFTHEQRRGTEGVRNERGDPFGFFSRLTTDRAAGV